MVIAMAMCGDFAPSGVAGDVGTAGVYAITMRVTARDETQSFGGNVDIMIPAGTRRSHFNDLISDAIVAFVNGGRNWTLDPHNLFFQPFDNGQ